MSVAAAPTVWAALGARLTGDLVRPGDDRFGHARQLQQMEFDAVTPGAVAYCADEQDVRACVAASQEHGVPLRVRSGGHSHNGWSTGEGALVLDVSRLNRVAAGPETVTLGPGAQSLDVLAALRPHGRQVVTGTFPTVAAAGFLTGGGLGWQTREFGLGCDRIVSARLVLADGRVVTCSQDEHPDLYWAVRGGGGGNFGVIVDLEVRPIRAPLLAGFDAVWGLERAPQLIAAWQRWCMAAPEALGTSLVVLPSFGPQKPAGVRVWGVYHGARPALERALADLTDLAGGPPREVEVSDPRPYADAMHQGLCGAATLAECHRAGSNPEAVGHRHPFTLRTYRLTDRPMTDPEATAAFEAWNPDLDQERYLLFIAVGGAATRVARTDTAFAHRGARFLAGYQYAIRQPEPSPERLAAGWAWTERTAATLDGPACGSYVNFPSTRPDPDWRQAFHGENYARLVEVQRRYDPDRCFRHPQSIGS